MHTYMYMVFQDRTSLPNGPQNSKVTKAHLPSLSFVPDPPIPVQFSWLPIIVPPHPHLNCICLFVTRSQFVTLVGLEVALFKGCPGTLTDVPLPECWG